ncbi:MAG TPA: SMP-30/gluconolactonase/LRE family protein [Micromonosporaceae bacterium]
MRAEQVTEAVTYHGEGPVWSARWGGLRWVDMLAGDVLSLRPDATVTRRRIGRIAAAVRPRSRGGAVFGVERGFALEDPDGTVAHLPELWADEQVRMNDGGCDPHGRFYCGSMAGRTGGGALYRLDPDGAVHVVLPRVTISNGLDWSPDGTRAYHNDTPTQQITVFDYDREAGLTDPRPLVRIPADAGGPDGLTVDSEGGVWVALHSGGAVHRYTPDGVLDEVIELPTPMVTACTFGGPGLDELFITTSREGLDADDPAAGALFRAEVGIAGQPVREYAG